MKKGELYEILSHELFKNNVKASGFAFESLKRDVKVIGKSGIGHQIDIFGVARINGKPVKVIFECKDYSRGVPLLYVRAAIGLREDIENSIIIIVCRSGAQSGAIKLARSSGINIWSMGKSPKMRLDISFTGSEADVVVHPDEICENSVANANLVGTVFDIPNSTVHDQKTHKTLKEWVGVRTGYLDAEGLYLRTPSFGGGAPLDERDVVDIKLHGLEIINRRDASSRCAKDTFFVKDVINKKCWIVEEPSEMFDEIIRSNRALQR